EQVIDLESRYVRGSLTQVRKHGVIREARTIGRGNQSLNLQGDRIPIRGGNDIVRKGIADDAPVGGSAGCPGIINSTFNDGASQWIGAQNFSSQRLAEVAVPICIDR